LPALAFTPLPCSPKWLRELTRSVKVASFSESEQAGTNPNLMRSGFPSTNGAHALKKLSRFCGLCALVNAAHLLADLTRLMIIDINKQKLLLSQPELQELIIMKLNGLKTDMIIYKNYLKNFFKSLNDFNEDLNEIISFV
jgi:hypothetical protein